MQPFPQQRDRMIRRGNTKTRSSPMPTNKKAPKTKTSPSRSPTPVTSDTPTRYKLTAPFTNPAGVTWIKGTVIDATPAEIDARGIPAEPAE